MENNLTSLFNSIENSNLYKEYKEIGNILDKDKSIKVLLDNIKELEHEANYLEYNDINKYNEVCNKINELSIELNNKPVYQEYLNRMKDFNNNIDNK